jgi:hypothetical protein
MASIREEIEQDLSRTGAKLVELKRLWLYWPALFSRQLSSLSPLYRVTATSVHGETISRVYAYDFLGWGESGRSGLKRHVQTGWIEVD